MKSAPAVIVAVVAMLGPCCSARRAREAKKPHATVDARRDAIRRAQVWLPTKVAEKDLKKGPGGHGAFEPQQLVACRYTKKEMSGNSAKFTCVLPPDDELKVKYGRDNGEVYAEVAATRLLWALGFPADRMYPVKVRCEGCPPVPEGTIEKGTLAKGKATLLFDPASIERKLKGHTIETKPDSGWLWDELDQVSETAGGAPQAQRDALKLLAVFLQHTDNKAAQQRLVCTDEGDTPAERCQHPVMMINDLGQTFGRSNLFNRDAVGSVNLKEWSAAHIWSDPKLCIGELPPSQTGSLQSPMIKEPGRKFLADLLMQLSDRQLHDLFEGARFGDRSERLITPPATVEQWVEAFKKKRTEIAAATCPG